MLVHFGASDLISLGFGFLFPLLLRGDTEALMDVVRMEA